MDKDYSKYNLIRLQSELEEEIETKEMIEESVSNLRRTLFDLQEKLHNVDAEGNEWKTRYETQIEMNGKLEKQISGIRKRLEDIRGNPMDRLASIRLYDDMPIEMLKQHLKLLMKEKSDLQGQLIDCHLQIKQEAKAFHKTNDERRAYLSEVAMFSFTRDAQRGLNSTHRQSGPENKQIRGKQTNRRDEADARRGKMEKKRGLENL